MLKKILIPGSLGITALAIMAVMFSMPVDVNEKTPGLMPPVDLHTMVGLEEITKDTPNKSTKDLKHGEVDEQAKGPNKEFQKYNSIRSVLGSEYTGVKILGDDTRITIMLSPERIPKDISLTEFMWSDEGILISMYERDGTMEDDSFTSNPSKGKKVVQINEEYGALIKSVSSQTLSDVTTDSPLTLRMLSDTHQITIKGFISDSDAISLANYLTTR